ncbi:DUF2163 domain-containing protein [Jannaschia sp. CCS1]|uniref:DUF2163 domain-containing protein n=1 Tax=Jannaschia sp. (strain CCS1) TaxID=290400 RepID=UPI000053A97F|nr:DUF2163 domain-containing protein [Jannaschia sp. CCS1]ABD54561.1 Phage conserved hypothetical protein BR0599 [Jannaschia sp. CCS1]
MSVQELDLHLKSGTTGVSRCWRVTRADGVQFGFTDHDGDLDFEGTTFRAGTGLSAAALSQTTGLSVDNTEAVGALSDLAITEEDIFAGRYDGAEVEAWLVQWAAPENRVLQFRGSLGEITRANGAFSAELRGLTEQMNVPTGRVFQRTCQAVLGDAECKFDLATAGYVADAAVTTGDGLTFTFEGLTSFASRWFERGQMRVLTGDAAGLTEAVKIDQVAGTVRTITLWDNLRENIAPGDVVRLTAGCDKRMATCRAKFANLVNYQGFPDIPSEDWQAAHPTRVSSRSGGSRR